MPQEFDACVNNGGKVRTMSIKGGRYMHICIAKDGKTYRGEVKEKKSPKMEEKKY